MKNPLWDNVFGPPKDKRATIDLMQSLPPFIGLSTRELVQVERSIHERHYKVDEIVFDEDMLGAGLYIIKEGTVVIEKKISDDNFMTLATLEDNNFFGEIGLLDEIPRTARARVLKETTLFAFCKPDLENLIDRNPRCALVIINNIGALISKRLIKTNEFLETLTKENEKLQLKHGTIETNDTELSSGE